ncbi:MAG TPA: M4 family metallopeptidase, partial [Chitinophagaceae bacterium]|nr:M4 family metallopeptidase [Chitinophagaceae bacterium]
MKSTLSLRGRWICLLLSGSFSLFAQAQKTPQQVEDLRRRLAGNAKIQSFELSEERQTPSLIRLKSGQGVPAAEAKTTLSGLLGLRAGTDELREVRRVASAGMEVVEYHQYYKGIRVEHARYTALVKGGRAEVFNGAFYEVPATLKLQPSLQKEGALEKAKSSVGARKWAWENAEEIYSRVKEAGQKAALLLELREYLPEGELVVVKDFTASGVARMRLAYKFNIYAVQPVSRAWIYVDAETGKLLLRDAIIKHVEDGPSATSVSVTVPTRYAGNRTVKTKQISGNDPNSGLPLTSSNPLEVYVPGSATYGLLDDTRGGGIETYDLNGVGGLPINFAPAYAQGKSFTDKDNNWTLAEHRRSGPAESENDDIAFDAHWGASVVYDYWKDKHARLSFDGKNGKIKSFIHSGFGYDNAFWNGTVMTYGDGSYPAPGGFRPLTSLDVCGHEIGHGVCSFTSDLVYAKESGAMNEALSDIWAACVEYYAIRRVDPALASRYKPFYIGEQISADPAAPLRRMDDPKSAGNPDTYGGTNWTSQVGCTPTLANDQCGVHNNSGVLNKWF